MKKRICILLGLLLFLFISCEQQESTYYSYVDALYQINAMAIRERGLTGKGVKIGVIDLGFATLPDNPSTSALMKNGQIKLFRQYYPDSQAVFFNHSEKHGYLVTFMMGGKSKRDSVFGGGLARDADFYLAKISKTSFETKSTAGEEENIGKALEDLYQRGVRLVNLSLGYWDDFNDSRYNYTPDQMDGKSTRIASIVQRYIDKGMCIVAAVGNTGEYSWRILWTPSDVKDVISVGACNKRKQPFRAPYSGIGNRSVDFVKPDLVCFSTWGTSVSAPIITSLIACMMEYDSTLTCSEIKNILHRSATLYPYPNNYIGYGIPDAEKVIKLLDDRDLDLSDAKTISTAEKKVEIRTNSREIVLFQKEGPYVVHRQYHLEPVDGLLTIRRKEGISHSTVVIDNKYVTEISWK